MTDNLRNGDFEFDELHVGAHVVGIDNEVGDVVPGAGGDGTLGFEIRQVDDDAGVSLLKLFTRCILFLRASAQSRMDCSVSMSCFE